LQRRLVHSGRLYEIFLRTFVYTLQSGHSSAPSSPVFGSLAAPFSEAAF
jgi:hypothetical protein